MKRLAIAALAAPLIIVPTGAFAESKTFDVATFHGVDVAAGIHAIVAGGTPLSVVADTANARDFDDLRVEVRGGILHVWREWSLGDLFNWNRPNITVTIGTEVLDSVEASSGALIDVVASFECRQQFHRLEPVRFGADLEAAPQHVEHSQQVVA